MSRNSTSSPLASPTTAQLDMELRHAKLLRALDLAAAGDHARATELFAACGLSYHHADHADRVEEN